MARCLEVLWITSELQQRVDVGYKVTEIHEAWQWKDKKEGTVC